MTDSTARPSPGWQLTLLSRLALIPRLGISMTCTSCRAWPLSWTMALRQPICALSRYEPIQRQQHGGAVILAALWLQNPFPVCTICTTLLGQPVRSCLGRGLTADCSHCPRGSLHGCRATH